jgi:hypothetical protein
MGSDDIVKLKLSSQRRSTRCGAVTAIALLVALGGLLTLRAMQGDAGSERAAQSAVGAMLRGGDGGGGGGGGGSGSGGGSARAAAIGDDPLHSAKRCFGMAWRNPRQKLSTRQIGRLHYPSDAEAHYFALMQATARFRAVKAHAHAGYAGPWVENVWIATFAQRPLAEFYPYVPLFVPWTDVWKAGAASYGDLAALLGGMLRPDVAYVTVSQNARGIPANALEKWSIPSVLVFSAGGYGHIPIPLLKRVLPLLPEAAVLPPRGRTVRGGAAGGDDARVAPLVAFAGSQRRGIRPATIKALKRAIAPATLSTYKGGAWQRALAEARFALVPRGFGRTTFMVAEVVQMGLTPLYVYDDEEWLPYRGSGGAAEWSRFGVSLALRNITRGAARLAELDDPELERMRAAARAVRESHFTYDGVMQQIIRFIQNGTATSDLRCVAFPRTTT